MSGPRPLKALLASWKPKGAQSATAPTFDQATAAFAAAWEQAVGSEIARRSRPHKFSNGTLTVLTASSAWSDELSLLAPKILEALQRACPDARLRRLRFMVASGRTKMLLEGERRRAQSLLIAQTGRAPATMPQAQGTAEATDLAGILQRLAKLQATLDAERDGDGWRTCPTCLRRFEPVAQATRCAVCLENSRRFALAQVERALMQAPWLSAQAIGLAIPKTSASTYERTRGRLLSRWQLDIAAAERRLRRSALTAQDRVTAWSYLMLLTGLMQRDIGRAVVSEVLGRDWAFALLGDGRARKEEARRPPREKH